MNDNSKQKLNAAFKALRKAGFIAKQSFMCCGSCASCAIAEQVKEMTRDRQAKVKGGVFYTRQDAADLRDTGRGWSYRRGEDRLLLAYGSISVCDVGRFGLPDEEVGAAIVEALTAAGLKTEWDGDAGKKIAVIVP